MKAAILPLALYLSTLAVVPIAVSEEESKNSEPAVEGFPQIAFRILKENDVASAHEMALTLEDCLFVQRKFAKQKDPPPSEAEILEKAKKDLEKVLREVSESIGKVRDEIGEFDWENAKLVGVKQAKLSERKEYHELDDYDPESTELRLEIALEISSGGKTVVAGIRECYYLHGRRRTSDGFLGGGPKPSE